MGLLGKVMGIMAPKPVEVPDGDATVKVYTYDGGPLAKVREGTTIRLTLVDGQHHMASVYTGTEMDGDSALAYKGKLVGFLGSGQEARTLKALRDRLGPLSVPATLTRWTRDGWPKVIVHFDGEWDENSPAQ